MIFRDNAQRESGCVRAIGFSTGEGLQIRAEGASASRATFGNGSGSQMIR
jgi:hypothetical protein